MKKCIIFNSICIDNSYLTRFFQKYAEDNNFEIIAIFGSAINAFDKNGYNEMITFLKQNKDINNILMNSVNSLTASYTDYKNLSELKNINIHFIEEAIVVNTTVNSDSLLKIMTENFVMNLSRRISLNIEYYILHGQIPFRPPYGYIKKRI